MSHKAVLFDLDGVLVKAFTTEPLAGAKERIASLRGQNIPFAIATNQAGPIWSVATGQAKYPSIDKIASNFREIIQSLDLQQTPWFVSMGDLRARDAMGEEAYSVAIDKLKIDLCSLLGELPIFAGSSPEWRKPAAGMLLTAAGALNINPGDCLYVGDMESDRQAALAAGMQFEMVQS